MFLTLLKARLAYMFSGTINRAKKNKPAGIAVAVSMVMLLIYLAVALFAVSIAIFFAVCRSLCDNGCSDVYFAIAALLAFVLGFIGSVAAAKSQVFESRDNDLLLSMPIPHRTIILSRLASLLAIEYVTQLFVALPCAIVYTFYYGFSLPIAALFALGFLFLPLMTLTASCLVGWLISLITSRMGRMKNLVSIVLYVAFFGGYMLVYTNIVSSDFGESFDNIAEMILPMANALRSFAPPMIWFGRGVVGSAPYFLLFALTAVIPALIMLWLMSRNFVSSTSRGQRTLSDKRTSGETRVRSLRKTLFLKDLSRLFSSAGYLVNSTSGVLMALVAIVIVISKADTIAELIALDPILTRLAPAALAALTVLLASMNTMSATLISVEGKTLWILKSLPIRGADVLISKLGAHIAVCAAPSAAAAAIIGAVMGISPLYIILVMLLCAAANVMFAAFGLTVNLFMPKFDWASETAAAKQSGSTVVSMFAGLFIAAFISAVAVVPTLFFDPIAGIILSVIITVGASALLSFYLLRSGGERFERLNSGE